MDEELNSTEEVLRYLSEYKPTWRERLLMYFWLYPSEWVYRIKQSITR